MTFLNLLTLNSTSLPIG